MFVTDFSSGFFKLECNGTHYKVVVARKQTNIYLMVAIIVLAVFVKVILTMTLMHSRTIKLKIKGIKQVIICLLGQVRCGTNVLVEPDPASVWHDFYGSHDSRTGNGCHSVAAGAIGTNWCRCDVSHGETGVVPSLPPSSVSEAAITGAKGEGGSCLLYTSPSPRDATLSRMPSSA